MNGEEEITFEIVLWKHVPSISVNLESGASAIHQCVFAWPHADAFQVKLIIRVCLV